ncbi:MAG: sigma-54 interaction domain-containing protein [bacterium]
MHAISRNHTEDHEALILDGDHGRCRSLGRWVGRAGYVPRAIETAEKARAELADPHSRLILADPGLLDPEGLTLFEELSTRPLPVTGTCLALQGESPSIRDGGGLSRFGRLIGRSQPMQRLYNQVLRVAPTSATVFLIGESGTGKELTAELIHGLSDRATRPFVPLNCGALSPGLIESELFGHERGSFTGADRRRPGLFEYADGGTLFLDEITEMPLDLQVKLLRVLESGQVRRVGGERAIDVDVRVIAATNRDPEKAAADGRLREDLLYRLLVFPVELPPLRQRREDVVLIARHYLDLFNRQEELDKSLTEDALEVLQTHAWPGNVRELRNALERAFILADEEISGSGFPIEPLRASSRAGSEEGDIGVRVGMPTAEAERRLILATLDRLQGDKKRAAKTLGISLKTLYNRLGVYRASSEGSKAASISG